MQGLLKILGLAILPLVVACAPVVSFQVDFEGEAVVEGAPLGSVLDAFPAFGGFVAFDVSSDQEFQNNDARKHQVTKTTLEAFEVWVKAPEDASLDFIEHIAVFADAPGLDRVRIAEASVPQGATRVRFTVDDVELAPYVRADTITLSTEVEGRQPGRDTTLGAAAVFSVEADLSRSE